MAAFEHEHNNKLKKLQKERVDGKISNAETDYLLEVGSMLKDFYLDQPPTVMVKPQRKPNMKQKPVKKREPSAVEKSQSIQSWAAVQSNQKEGAFLKKYSEAFGTANIANKLQSTDMGLTSAETVNDELCPECNAECLVNHREAALVCTKCGLTRDFIEGSTANLTYDQEMSIATSSNSPYVRENHLNELLAQIQGKETTQVPQHVLDAVKLEYKKDGITSRKKVTPEATLRYLKKLAFSDNHWVRQYVSQVCLSMSWASPLASAACMHLCVAMRKTLCTRSQTSMRWQPSPVSPQSPDLVQCYSSTTTMRQKETPNWTARTQLSEMLPVRSTVRLVAISRCTWVPS